MFLLYDRRVCTHSIDSSLADGEFPGLGLALAPDVLVPEAEHGVHMKQKSRFFQISALAGVCIGVNPGGLGVATPRFWAGGS